MNSVATSLVLIPGAVALLVLLVFTYLYEQNRHSYFRAWQLAWAAYTLHYAAQAVEYYFAPSALLFLLSSLLLVAMALCIFVSTRLMKESFRLKWYDVAIALTGVVLTYFGLRAQMASGLFSEKRHSCPSICAWKSGWPRCCSIAPSISTATPFAGIRWRFAPSHSPSPYGQH